MSPAPVLRAATYNVHGCVGMDRQRSESRIAEVIASMSVDVVGLQELDARRSRSARADQAALIAEQLGWKHHFHPAMQNGDEQYGDAIVSRLPFTVKRAEQLPGIAPWYCRETRGALWLEVETALGPVQLINTHLGLGRSERVLQAQWLLGEDWLGSIARDVPALLLGDFNSVRTSPAYRIFARALRDVRSLVAPQSAFRTYPTRLPSLAVDHIFVNDALHPTDLQVHRSPLARVASDHYPLVAELARKVPEPP
ncbi:MAG: endonuclease/exonuclease/phosphatase family protein [Chthoniobacterales bacterium]